MFTSLQVAAPGPSRLVNFEYLVLEFLQWLRQLLHSDQSDQAPATGWVGEDVPYTDQWPLRGGFKKNEKEKKVVGWLVGKEGWHFPLRIFIFY